MKQRGMVKWQPFVSLPEQVSYTNKLLEKMNRVDRPVLDQEQLEVINNIILECYNGQDEIGITFYVNGFFQQIQGYIKKVDSVNHYIILKNEKVNKFKIAFCDIFNVEVM